MTKRVKDNIAVSLALKWCYNKQSNKINIRIKDSILILIPFKLSIVSVECKSNKEKFKDTTNVIFTFSPTI